MSRHKKLIRKIRRELIRQGHEYTSATMPRDYIPRLPQLTSWERFSWGVIEEARRVFNYRPTSENFKTDELQK